MLSIALHPRRGLGAVAARSLTQRTARVVSPRVGGRVWQMALDTQSEAPLSEVQTRPSALVLDTDGEAPLSEEQTRPSPLVREFRGVSDRTKPKRKVCIHLGFFGTNYYGMLYQASGLRTVERELLAALNTWGGISDDNSALPSKVGWQRASRTDKGVHAVGATVSCKLLLADDELEEQPAIGDSALTPPPPVTAAKQSRIDALNRLLPPDMRVFSIQRTRGSFDAYHSCSARQYLYLLPERALGPGGAPELSAILNRFQGTHCFHNFAGGIRSPAGLAAELEALIGEPLGWELSAHPLRPRSEAFRSVLRCELQPGAVVTADGTRYVAVLIDGRSFVLHQIRHMVGAALAVAHGVVPLPVFLAALDSPFKVDVSPLAPGEALCLLRNEFFNEKTKVADVLLPAQAERSMAAFLRGPLVEHVHALDLAASERWRAEVAAGQGQDTPGRLAAQAAEAVAEAAAEEESEEAEAESWAAQAEAGPDASAAQAQSRREPPAPSTHGEPPARLLESGLPRRRSNFRGWDEWVGFLGSGSWLEQGKDWDQLHKATARLRDASERLRAERDRKRAERFATLAASDGGGADGEAGGQLRKSKQRPILPGGVQTAVAVEFKLLPGPALEEMMARLRAAVEAGTLASVAPPDTYIRFLRESGDAN